MSVIERTCEIGTMKAIGAKNKDILSLFLVEAGIISFIGGILGVIVGWGISVLVNMFILRYILTNIDLVVSPLVLIGGLIVAIVTGVIGGMYPAFKAAKMKPAEALVHE